MLSSGSFPVLGFTDSVPISDRRCAETLISRDAGIDTRSRRFDILRLRVLCFTWTAIASASISFRRIFRAVAIFVLSDWRVRPLLSFPLLLLSFFAESCYLASRFSPRLE